MCWFVATLVGSLSIVFAMESVMRKVLGFVTLAQQIRNIQYVHYVSEQLLVRFCHSKRTSDPCISNGVGKWLHVLCAELLPNVRFVKSNQILKIVKQRIGESFEEQINVEYVERFEFYERAKKCYAVIATGYSKQFQVTSSETSQYANIILQKGVITNPEY